MNQLRVTDTEPITSKDRITYETINQESFYEYHNLVDYNHL